MGHDPGTLHHFVVVSNHATQPFSKRMAGRYTKQDVWNIKAREKIWLAKMKALTLPAICLFIQSSARYYQQRRRHVIMQDFPVTTHLLRHRRDLYINVNIRCIKISNGHWGGILFGGGKFV